jgi:hypothetical protein
MCFRNWRELQCSSTKQLRLGYYPLHICRHTYVVYCMLTIDGIYMDLLSINSSSILFPAFLFPASFTFHIYLLILLSICICLKCLDTLDVKRIFPHFQCVSQKALKCKYGVLCQSILLPQNKSDCAIERVN